MAWRVLLLASTLALSTLDAALLEIRYGYFSSGYGGGFALVSPLRLSAFAGASLLCDAGVLLALYLGLVALLRALRLRPLAIYLLSGFLALLVPFSLSLARHVLEIVVGRVLSLVALWELADRSASEVLAQALDQVPAAGWAALLAVAGGAGALSLSRYAERWLGASVERFRAPRLRTLLGTAVVCIGGSSALLSAAGASLDDLRFGIERKPSAILLRELVSRMTDVDRDGSGWLSRPGDGAPFDAGVHPFALDVPGNGVDEDGLAGDQPPGLSAPARVSAPLPARGSLPHGVLLVFLETFRADLVGARFHGRPITPVLERLASQGARSERCYAHTPGTAPSRGQLFGGTLAPELGRPTLVDDFRELGYQVALFSGQDDSYGNGRHLMGAERADRHYDAREDRLLRINRSASAGALQVPDQQLLRRIGEFLDERDPARPLFLYVNLVDAHFPYHHAQLEDLLDVEPVSRHQIRVDRAERVYTTYANAAANVDRSLGELLSRMERHLGEAPVVIVTADHGEAMYEQGFLGHGHTLDETQTRVPLIVRGLGGVWPEPLGLADLRGLLREHLPSAQPDARPHFVPAADRTVLQFVPQLERPRRIALRSLQGSAEYDFASAVLERRGENAPDLAQLVQAWTATRLLVDARTDPAALGP
jgi:hypothetical protein